MKRKAKTKSELLASSEGVIGVLHGLIPEAAGGRKVEVKPLPLADRNKFGNDSRSRVVRPSPIGGVRTSENGRSEGGKILSSSLAEQLVHAFTGTKPGRIGTKDIW